MGFDLARFLSDLRVTHGNSPHQYVVYGLNWGRGINDRALAGADVGGFVSVNRSPHRGSPPQPSPLTVSLD